MLGAPSSRRVAFAAVWFLVLGAGEGVVRADGTDACLAAYEKSQQLKQDGKLAASREQLVQCVQPTSPEPGQKDCSQWLAELDASTPTVIVNARDGEGKDVAKVRVLVDGVVLMNPSTASRTRSIPGFICSATSAKERKRSKRASSSRSTKRTASSPPSSLRAPKPARARCKKWKCRPGHRSSALLFSVSESRAPQRSGFLPRWASTTSIR